MMRDGTAGRFCVSSAIGEISRSWYHYTPDGRDLLGNVDTVTGALESTEVEKVKIGRWSTGSKSVPVLQHLNVHY